MKRGPGTESQVREVGLGKSAERGPDMKDMKGGQAEGSRHDSVYHASVWVYSYHHLLVLSQAGNCNQTELIFPHRVIAIEDLQGLFG